MPTNILKRAKKFIHMCVCVCLCYLHTGSDAGVSLIRLGPPQLPLLSAKKGNKTLILLKLINDINLKELQKQNSKLTI